VSALATRFRHLARFATIYIREAHPIDGWFLEGEKYSVSVINFAFLQRSYRPPGTERMSDCVGAQPPPGRVLGEGGDPLGGAC
jgi:hypothetical protein